MNDEVFSTDFTGTIWKYSGKAGWHFITLPEDVSSTIKLITSDRRRGWGSVRVSVVIGETRWDTSIFPDKKKNAYVLPVKADVRKKESLADQDTVGVWLSLISLPA